MSKSENTFFEKYASGNALPDDIHDAIDSWHESESQLSLHDYLGMTWAEYAFWAKYPNKLHVILMSRLKKSPLEVALSDEAISLAARNCREEDMGLLKEWIAKYRVDS